MWCMELSYCDLSILSCEHVGDHQKYEVYKEQMKKMHEAGDRLIVQTGVATDTINQQINTSVEKIIKEAVVKDEVESDKTKVKSIPNSPVKPVPPVGKGGRGGRGGRNGGGRGGRGGRNGGRGRGRGNTNTKTASKTSISKNIGTTSKSTPTPDSKPVETNPKSDDSKPGPGPGPIADSKGDSAVEVDKTPTDVDVDQKDGDGGPDDVEEVVDAADDAEYDEEEEEGAYDEDEDIEGEADIDGEVDVDEVNEGMNSKNTSKYPSTASLAPLTPTELKEREVKRVAKAVDTLKNMRSGLLTLDHGKFAQSCRRFRTGKG